MVDRTRRAPAYRHYKPKNLAVVRIHGKDFYLGPYDSPASWEKYHRLIAERFYSDPIELPRTEERIALLSLKELSLHFFTFCEGYYRRDGEATSEVVCVQQALRRLLKLFGDLPAIEFSPSKLKLVRDEFIRDGQCRSVVNNNISRIKRMFRWAVENELIPVAVHQALATVTGLKKGRSEVRESAPIAAVSDAAVEATLRYLTPTVQAMVRLQLLTGCRPGEICILHPVDVERSEDVWCYTPRCHKTAHHDIERRIFLGPRAQEILRPWLDRDAEAFCFSPLEAVAHQRSLKASRRRTPLDRGNRAGTNCKAAPKRMAGDRYTTTSYRRAIERACDQAFPLPPDLVIAAEAELTEAEILRRETIALEWRHRHRWHPNQLRHTRATELRKLHGLDAAQVVLGHSEAFVTQIYAERDFSKAADIMRQSG